VQTIYISVCTDDEPLDLDEMGSYLALDWKTGPPDGGKCLVQGKSIKCDELSSNHTSYTSNQYKYQSNRQKQSTTLTSCMDLFTKPENLSEDDSWRCPRYVLLQYDCNWHNKLVIWQIFLNFQWFILWENSSMWLGSNWKLNLKHNLPESVYTLIVLFCSPWYVICRCKKPVEATKQMSLWKLPPVLIVQLKRFSFKYVLYSDKIDKFVDYPIE